MEYEVFRQQLYNNNVRLTKRMTKNFRRAEREISLPLIFYFDQIDASRSKAKVMKRHIAPSLVDEDDQATDADADVTLDLDGVPSIVQTQHERKLAFRREILSK